PPDVMTNLSKLAESGLAFDSAYATYPESIKGLFSILCSIYPAFDVGIEAYASAPCQSLPSQLSGLGYATALFHSGRFMYLGMESVISNRGYDRLEDAGHIGGNHHSSFGLAEHATVARLLQWIDARRDALPSLFTYL